MELTTEIIEKIQEAISAVFEKATKQDMRMRLDDERDHNRAEWRWKRMQKNNERTTGNPYVVTVSLI